MDQLTREAAVIVRGVVTSTKIEPHPQLKNLTTAVVSMQVLETYKGQSQKKLVFRQFVWDLRTQLSPQGYEKGQEVVLFLEPVSEYGLTSPVGLEQGRFRVTRDRQGRATVLNGRGNAGLFNSVEQRARAQGKQLSPRTATLAKQNKSGPLALSELEEAIRALGGDR